MFRLLIDTSVWLDLAKDYRQAGLPEALEALVEMGEVELIVPRVVVSEFSRNKNRVAEHSSRSISTALKRAKDIIDRLGEGKGKKNALAHLNEIDYRLPQLGESVVGAIGRIDALFSAFDVIEASDSVIIEAARRAVDGRAPVHRGRNSIADAILIELYRSELADAVPNVRYAFVTHNTKDFSLPSGDDRKPHPDIAELFTRIKSLYFISLAKILKKISPYLLADIEVEQEWAMEPHRLSEIVDAIDELIDKVWYGRHGLLREGVESGRIAVVEKETYPRDRENPTVQKDIWLGARKAAERVERKYGIENLGPWDDFEWGMLSGKLSALRWVLGDEWDMLDT